MTIIIKEKEFSYTSDYPEGWVFAKGDSFKKVKVDKHTCFIKRFEAKTPDNISGWKLMTSLKGKNENNLARIYDIVGTKENGKNIYYVFYEFIEGDTLNHLVEKHAYVDLERLTDNLFTAINSLQKRDYWFPDFIEKNIFCPKMGGYVLIDLDSVHPISDLPDNDMWADKEYWALIFHFYKSILNKSDLTYSDVNGISLNYLIIVFMILRLKIYQSDTGKEYHELFNDLPAYLNRISFSVEGLFERIYQNPDPLPQEDITGIRNMIRSKIISLTPEKIALLVEGEALDPAVPEPELPVPETLQPEIVRRYQPEPPPVIARFESNAGFIEKGKRFHLNWEVKNATKIRLFRNGMVIREPETGKGNIVLTEPYDGIDKEVEFRLHASNVDGETESNPITIFIKESVIIEDFKEKKNKSIINRRQIPWLIFAGIVVAGIIAIAFSRFSEDNKKVSISNFAPTSVFENYTLVISGQNFPLDSGDLKVLFNKQAGTLLFNSENLISVTVPELEKNADSLVTLAIIAKGDTLYAANKNRGEKNGRVNNH